jgi:Ca-activated chloride channel family protein
MSAALSLAALVALGARAAIGQGLIVDQRHGRPIAGSFEVKSVEIDARVRDQVAEVQVTQTFHNPNSFEMESEFVFPLADDGAVQNFVLMVDGKELPGRLLDRDEARKIYEEIVRRRRDPALLEYMGQGMIRTSIFPIPPRADRTVTMRYTRLCKRDRDVVEFTYPLSTQKYSGKPIQKLEVVARLEGKEPIKSIYSPSSDVEIDRDGDRRATVRLTLRDVVPTRDFRLLYSLHDGAVGATVLSYKPSDGEDGYVLVLASPNVERESEDLPSKTVVFVLDRSGSMTGKKIEQARNALKFVLDNLREGDTFNILTYDDRVEAYKPELQRYDGDSKRDALRFVENIRPGGSTNIDEALREALKQARDRDRPTYVLFLTDGLPTAGATNEAEIVAHAREANMAKARIFAFGVGDDVNARLLDRLSGGHGGTSEYLRPDQDIEASVSRFFRRLTSPVLSGLKLTFEAKDTNRGYPRELPDLFEGGQLVWVGRYREGGRTELELEGRVGGERRTFSFPVELARSGDGTPYRFVETLWAVRRVGDLIDQIDLHGKNKELIDELVALSKRHGILTPYTSFLADERTDLDAAAVNVRIAEERLAHLGQVGGSAGVGQRAYKAQAQNALSDLSLAAPEAPADRRGGMRASGRIVAGPPAAVGGGGLGGQPTRPTPAPALNASPVVAHDLNGRAEVAANVRKVGDKTFFHRGDTWIDSTVTAEQEESARRVEQFSDAYFDLARKQGHEQNQYLTFEEPVVVNLDGVTYRIDRPRQ